MRAHEVLDLVSDEEDDDGRQQQDENRAPSEAEMESKYDSPPPSSSHRKRRHLALVAPDASAIDDALSVVSISDAEQGSTPAHRRPHFAPASSSDDDESGDLSNADVHADFTTSTTPALSLALTPSTLSSDVDTPATSAALRPKKRPKRSVARYFGGGEDLSLKCWNCSSGGHTAADCPQERLFPPCYVCGQSTETHEKGRGCPNELCWRCGGAGHTKIVSAAPHTQRSATQRTTSMIPSLRSERRLPLRARRLRTPHHRLRRTAPHRRTPSVPCCH